MVKVIIECAEIMLFEAKWVLLFNFLDIRSTYFHFGVNTTFTTRSTFIDEDLVNCIHVLKEKKINSELVPHFSGTYF